jgi:hypothetical protein
MQLDWRASLHQRELLSLTAIKGREGISFQYVLLKFRDILSTRFTGKNRLVFRGEGASGTGAGGVTRLEGARVAAGREASTGFSLHTVGGHHGLWLR